MAKEEKETQAINLPAIKAEVNTQLADAEVKTSLLATVFKGLTELSMRKAMFEAMMRGHTMRDFLVKNVYAVPFNRGENYAIVNSIDYCRKIGMRSGVVGTEKPVYETEQRDGKEAIVSCTVTVKRMVSGYVGDFTATAYFNEYYKAGREYQGKYTPSMWDTKPRTMIAKVAEMHALRKACPEELSQAYIEEEFDRETAPPAGERARVITEALNGLKAETPTMGDLSANEKDNASDKEGDAEKGTKTQNLFGVAANHPGEDAIEA